MNAKQRAHLRKEINALAARKLADGETLDPVFWNGPRPTAQQINDARKAKKLGILYDAAECDRQRALAKLTGDPAAAGEAAAKRDNQAALDQDPLGHETYFISMNNQVVVAIPKSAADRAALCQQAAETTVLLQRARDFAKLVDEELGRSYKTEHWPLREIGNRLKKDLIDFLS